MGRSVAMGLVLALGVTWSATAQTTQTTIDQAQLPSAARGPNGQATDPGQIAPPARHADLGAAQIGGAPKAGGIDAAQLTQTAPTAEAAPGLSTPNQGRNTRLGAVGGHDRCDPAETHPADHAACDQIIDNHADAFATTPRRPDAAIVDPDAPAPNIVNDIVNGGTGTVVSIPK
jgi:hypothetical protein